MFEHRRDLSTVLFSEGADMADLIQPAFIVQCSQCGGWLTLADFYAEKRSPSGLRANCKACHRAAVKRRAEDPTVRPAVRAYQEQYRAGRRQEARTLTAEYRAANPDRVRAVNEAWRALPANRESARRRAREFRLANPDLRAEYEKRRRASKKSSVVGFIAPADLAAKMRYWGNRCWMCSATTGLQVDHVKPLSKGGPHMLANLRPACGPCNLAKSDRWPLAPA